MRTAIMTLILFVISSISVYAENINICLPEQIVPTKSLTIGNTGVVHFNNKTTHVADAKINYMTTNIFQKSQILYLTNLSVMESSLAVAYRNGMWILFHDNGSFAPTKNDYVATAIFHDENGIAIGEHNTYTPIMEYKGYWKVDGRRGRIEDVDLYTTVGLIYIDEHDNLIITRDDTSEQMSISYSENGFSVKLIENE